MLWKNFTAMIVIVIEDFGELKKKSYITRKKWKYIILQVPFSLDYFVKVK